MFDEIIIEAMIEKKAINIVTIDFGNSSSTLFTKFIICNGTSQPHIDAISSNIDKTVRKKTKTHPHHIEGLKNAEWVLIDYGDVLVHVFNEESRKFYNLEELWGDCQTTYHSSNN